MKTDHSPNPAVGTNVVILTLRDKRLYLLLVNRANHAGQAKWALPGGPLRLGEDIDQSARHGLEQETGVTGLYLEQLYTFSETDKNHTEWDITVAHYALLALDNLHVGQTDNDGAVDWFQLDQLPELWGNHEEIVTMAHARLASKLEYSTIALQFLPETFTLRDLQEVYEIILDQQLDKRNFRKSVLAKDYIGETGEKQMSGAHRPAKLYRVKSPGKVEFMKWAVTKKVYAQQVS